MLVFLVMEAEYNLKPGLSQLLKFLPYSRRNRPLDQLVGKKGLCVCVKS